MALAPQKLISPHLGDTSLMAICVQLATHWKKIDKGIDAAANLVNVANLVVLAKAAKKATVHQGLKSVRGNQSPVEICVRSE